jgi:hypothetical protein
LLNTLGTVYLQLGDWLRAGDVERTLRARDAEIGGRRLRTAILVGQGQVDEALADAGGRRQRPG